MYDFVLFENFHLAYNHYKDICIIAKMLVASGYSVAIADVYDEAKQCIINGIPHIPIKVPKPVIRKSGNIPVLRVLENHVQTRKRWKYLTKVVEELIPICRNIYAGSYHVGLSLDMIKAIPADKNIFFWGLRSSRLYEYKLHKDWNSWNCYRVSRYVKSHNNVKLFVSDELIKQEFQQLGVNCNRLVIRPERTIDKLATKGTERATKHQHNCLKLLSIGTLRPQKRIETVLSAIKHIEVFPIEYTIAGKADDSYECIIQEAMIGVEKVFRKNYRLSEEEFNQLIDNCDFLILCDKKSCSNVTNGTLNEALLRGRPIIAPSHEPYKSIVGNNGVGILFEDGVQESICEAIMRAFNKGSNAFMDSIINYQKTFYFPSVVERFRIDMKQCIGV